MRSRRLDPLVYILLGLGALTLVSVLLLLATRSCVQVMQEALEGEGTYGSEHAMSSWVEDATELELGRYAAFVELVSSVDLGVDAHLGASMEEVKQALGEPDLAARKAGGSYEYTYFCDPRGTGASPSERRGKSLLPLPFGTLKLVVDGDEVQRINLTLLEARRGKGMWGYLTFGGKPLVECAQEDFIAIFGEPLEAGANHLVWCWKPAGGQAEEALLVKLLLSFRDGSPVQFTLARLQVPVAPVAARSRTETPAGSAPAADKGAPRPR